MKKLITLLAVTASFAMFTPVALQAGDHHHYSSRSYSHACGSCGSSVYRERVYVGRNHCGEPVYTWRTVGHSCRSGSGHGGWQGSGHGSSHHGSSSHGHISVPGFHFDFGGHGSRH